MISPSSWEQLTLEDCDLTSTNVAPWISSCIPTLQRLVLRKNDLSLETLQSIGEAYLTFSAQRRDSKKTRKRIRKNPLQVLDLSNNVWSVQTNSDNSDEQTIGGGGSDVLSRLSWMASLASWMDSLSNLLELNLSYNPQIFSHSEDNRAMADLCGTVNQSLKRLSLRGCRLSPRDLNLLSSTFCWIEALDLSENPALLQDMSSLSFFEHLGELVLENMSDANEGHGDYSSLVDFLSRMQNNDDKETHEWRPLEYLNLSGNSLDNRALMALSRLTMLKILMLVGCQLQSESLTMLLGNEKQAQERYRNSWRELHLGSNNIGDAGAKVLARGLKTQQLSSLRVLQLESNTVSVHGLKVLVNEGLAHSRRLESLVVWDHGAVTPRQQVAWLELEEKMQHYLLLNQAGRHVLYFDGHEKAANQNDTTDNSKRKTIPAYLWPFILEQADEIYGTEALYHFLNKRPDVILASEQPQKPVVGSPLKLLSRSNSPKSVMETNYF